MTATNIQHWRIALIAEDRSNIEVVNVVLVTVVVVVDVVVLR